MIDLVASLGVMLLGAALLAFAARRAEPWEKSVLVVSFLAHIAAAFAQVWITRDYYGYGDMMTYYYNGVVLSDLLSHDFSTFAPEVVQLLVHQPGHLPLEDVNAASTTGTLLGFAGFALLGLGGSLYALCLLVAVASFGGKILLYWSMRDEVSPGTIVGAAYASLLTPSVVFWSSGYLKESFAIAALGPLLYAMTRLTRREYARALMFGGPAVLVMGLIKPYILFPFALGLGAYLYTTRAARLGVIITLRPAPIIVASAIVVLTLAGLGEIFPDYAVDRVAQKASEQQEIGGRIDPGGSQYSLGNEEEKTLAGQLAFAPIALITALFRPFIFESKNVLMFINGLETAVITWLFLTLVFAKRLKFLIADTLRRPMLSFSLVFTLTFGLAVGLASSNLGTLSRYRMPLLPFFLVVLVAGRKRDEARDPAPVSA